MIELSRTVRFCINFAARAEPSAPKHNTYAGYPSMDGLGAYYELEVRCRGEADPVTGYLINISSIDQAVRETAIPIIQHAVEGTPYHDPGLLLREILERLQPSLASSIHSIRWNLTPYYSLALRADAMNRVIIRQQFDFAAAHRLHCPALSDEENRDVFGRCNNPNGHGHNYRLQVEASTAIDEKGLSLPVLERIVNEAIVERFDHTHLNLDTEEFAGLNPSVEHIARTCHDLLLEPISEAGGALERVTIWETDRTSCTYPA